MKKLLLLLFIIGFYKADSQTLTDAQLDSLYEKFLVVRNIVPEEHPEHPLEPHDLKCGFGLINQIKHNIDRFSQDKQQLLKTYLDRPIRQTSMVSPSGFFRIHYNTSGTGVPRYNNTLTTEQNVMQVALALDSSYNFEVNFLGYPPPPPDNGMGGDDRYDVYIIDFGGSVYGYTEIETHLGQQRYTSYMVIDNDYSGYFSTGLNGMMVTVAHEFHHAIQVGNYIFESEDIYFYEITSTAMEEFVFDTINDYYAYMPDYFTNPGRAFASNNGYNLAIWNIFLRDKFGYNILKRQWEMMPNLRALAAIQNSLAEVNSTFSESFNEFGIWTFFTGYRRIPGVYFSEAANYPIIRYATTVPFSAPSRNVEFNVKPTSNNFIAFVNSAVSPNDTLVAIITNSDYISGTDSLLKNFLFEYILSVDSLAGSTRLTNRYFAKLNVSQTFWSVSEILNNQVVRQNGTTIPLVEGDELFAYPNPFYYNKSHNFITIVIDEGGAAEYDFNVYTSGMELVYSELIPVSNKTIRWDLRSKINGNLASGVYIYALRSGNKTHIGKLVIFND